MENDEALLLKNQLCFPLYAVTNKIIRLYQPYLDSINLTYTQYIVMMVMWEKKVVNQKEIGEMLYLQSNTLTPLLKKLQCKGYINIAKDKKDKRNLVITLTEKGEDLKKDAHCVGEGLVKQIHFNPEEVVMVKDFLYRILEHNGYEN